MFKAFIPKFIYFTGVDGSGKSTYVGMLLNEFESHGYRVKRVWLRFNYFFTKPVLFYCRLVGLTRRPIIGNRKISVHDFYKCPLIGRLVQYLHFIDTCLFYFFKVFLSVKFDQTYILCDRFVYDILADFMIENRDMNIPKKRIGKLLLKLLPTNSLELYFKVDKKEIVRRKPEVVDDEEDYDLKYSVYEYLESYFDFSIIDNSRSIQSVFKEIEDIIFSSNEVKKSPEEFQRIYKLDQRRVEID